MFLISCEDADSLLGFKDPKPRFEVRYFELPISSEMVLLDSIRTQNIPNEENRLLAGRYSDPIFGGAHAEGIMQFYPSNLTTTVTATSILDSAFFVLRSDYFQYGSSIKSDEKFTLHELTQTLKQETQNYFSKTPTSYNLQPIGSASVSVDPAIFKKEFDDSDTDPTLNLKFALDGAYANRLLKAINKDDKAFTDFDQFREVFKGLAVVPSSNDKILGFNLSGSVSAITLYYHDGDQKYTFNYFLSGAVSYSRLNYDRANTELSGITEFYKGYSANSRRGVQSGSGLITKLNFKDFFHYTDTIPNIVFNSVELVVSNVEPAENFYAPALALAMLREDNRPFSIRRNSKADSTKDANDAAAFRGLLQEQNTAYIAASDNVRTPFAMNYNPNDKSFSGFCTLFFQELYYLKKNGKAFENFSLYPIFPLLSKSVYRTAFRADQIKLRIYYTRPLTVK